DGQFESGPTGWPRNDGEAQAALFMHLRDTLHAGGEAWREFPTRIEVAARNGDVMFGCYASALGGGRVALRAGLPDSVVGEVERLAAPAPAKRRRSQRAPRKARDEERDHAR